ncbi:MULTISPECIES: hypothetical protein [unclassified Mesorhizobium]|uniref:hypothetical protein n=1 Tax=unclassified Mesorhizobium TaxID=325217 RepID=UPI00333D406A
MSYDYDERKWFFERRTDKTIISKRIPGMAPGQHLRIATHMVEGEAGLVFGTIKDEVVLRRTPAGRYELKATFLEDDRSISSLTIQKHLSRTGPHDKQHFTLVGPEINTLIGFLAGLVTIPLDDASKVHVSDDVVRDLVLNQAQARRIFEKNSDVFLELAQNVEVARDLVALGYRRKQLAHFDRLLNDNAFFSAERQRLGCRPEDVWQRFFEANTWIFRYGLSYQLLS